MESKKIRRYAVVGSRRVSNMIYAGLSFLACFGFFAMPTRCFILALKTAVPDACENGFWPQGFVLIFYGLLALGFGLYLGFVMVLNIGSGWNIFDLEKQYVRIFRWGFPGKNRRIDLTYPFETILAIACQKKATGAQLYLVLKDQRQIPFCGTVAMGFEPMEALASDLAGFLQKEVQILT